MLLVDDDAAIREAMALAFAEDYGFVADLPTLTIRAYSRGSDIYLVPRENGHEVVLGATVEELGFDQRVTAGAVYELLRDGRTVMPMTAEYALAETHRSLVAVIWTAWCWLPATIATACC